jgi:general secretion pathway protein B
VSYILDALKKAEKERRRGAEEDVTAVRDARPAEKTDGRRIWTYLLLGALFLNAALLVWWLGYRNAERPAGSAQSAGRERVIEATEKVGDAFDPSAPVKSLPAEKERPILRNEAASLARVGKAPLSSEEVTAAVKEKGRRTSGSADIGDRFFEKPEAADEVKKGVGEVAAVPPPSAGKKIYAMNQLPSPVRQSLPDLSMSLHYFTNDRSSRLISINGQTLREGQDVTAGLRVEEITNDGAVFDYQHYRFFVGLRR